MMSGWEEAERVKGEVGVGGSEVAGGVVAVVQSFGYLGFPCYLKTLSHSHPH